MPLVNEPHGRGVMRVELRGHPMRKPLGFPRRQLARGEEGKCLIERHDPLRVGVLQLERADPEPLELVAVGVAQSGHEIQPVVVFAPA